MSSFFDPAQVVQTGNMMAMIGWLILIVGPRRIQLICWVPKYVIPGLLSAVYSGLMLANFFETKGGFGSLSEIQLLFTSDPILAAGWLHYLAFDLFIGAWIARSADEAQISRIIQVPILVATFMFGPMGLLLFLLTRGAKTAIAARGGASS